MKAEIAAEKLWGPDVNIKVVRPGVLQVDTSCHGGFLIEKQAAKKFLTPAAARCGVRIGQFLAYEEDSDATIVFFEHPELLHRPVTTKLKNNLLASVSQEHPKYLAARKIIVQT